jgi:S-adenosylmethionine-dependent methyltransferase
MGGGPGRYAIWLSEIGCDVTLVDLSKNNIDYALEMAAQRGLVLRVIQADARFLDALSGELFDHVLLMGPLYHLPDENDRIKVIRETMSLLKTSGTLFSAFISAQ